MIKKGNQNKIPKAFSVALLFAVLFWLLIKMSKEYQAIVTFPVAYVNIPQNKLIQEVPLKEIEIQIKASGFKLFGLHVFQKEITLDARRLQRKSESEYYFLMQNQKISYSKSNYKYVFCRSDSSRHSIFKFRNINFKKGSSNWSV